MAIIECLAGIVFVYHEAFLADIGPYCEGADLGALIADSVRLYRMNQAKRTSRLQRMRYWVDRLARWMPMEKRQFIERPDTPCGMLSGRPPDYRYREQRVHSR